MPCVRAGEAKLREGVMGERCFINAGATAGNISGSSVAGFRLGFLSVSLSVLLFVWVLKKK